MMRDNSPPEAMCSTGPGGCPAFVAIRYARGRNRWRSSSLLHLEPLTSILNLAFMASSLSFRLHQPFQPGGSFAAAARQLPRELQINLRGGGGFTAKLLENFVFILQFVQFAADFVAVGNTA